MQAVLNKFRVVTFPATRFTDSDKFFGGGVMHFACSVIAAGKSLVFFIGKHQRFFAAAGAYSAGVGIFGNLLLQFKNGCFYLFNMFSCRKNIKSIFGKTAQFSKIIKNIHLCRSLFCFVGAIIIGSDASESQERRSIPVNNRFLLSFL